MSKIIKIGKSRLKDMLGFKNLGKHRDEIIESSSSEDISNGTNVFPHIV